MDFDARSDGERRQKQAEKYARIMLVNYYIEKWGSGVEAVKRISEKLGVSERTIYRDKKVVEIAQEIMRKELNE